MKQLFLLLLLPFLLFSCSNQEKELATLDNEEIQKSLHRGIDNAKEIHAYKVIELGEAQADNDEDAVTSIQRNLMGAEKEAQTLAVDFSCSDEAAKSYFSFNIKSEDTKDLIFEVYDEEGYEVGQNTLNITAGNNYKGLNVKSLQNGTYIIRFKDETGAEMSQTFTVEN